MGYTPVPELTAEQRAEARADLAELGMTLEGPNYFVVVLGGERRPDPPAPESNQPGE